MLRRTAVAAAVLAATLALSGCASGDDGSAVERLAAAQLKLATTQAVTLSLSSSDVPSSVSGIQSATGTAVIDGALISFEGQIQGRMGGLDAVVDILAIGDDTYMKLFTPDYEPVDLAAIGAPNPTELFSPEAGIPSLLAETTGLSTGEQVREGGEVLTELNGTLSGDKIRALLQLGEDDSTFAVTYALTEDDELRKVTLRGEFWPDTESTYSMLLTDYGKVITIEAPTS